MNTLGCVTSIGFAAAGTDGNLGTDGIFSGRWPAPLPKITRSRRTMANRERSARCQSLYLQIRFPSGTAGWWPWSHRNPIELTEPQNSTVIFHGTEIFKCAFLCIFVRFLTHFAHSPFSFEGNLGTGSCEEIVPKLILADFCYVVKLRV